MLLVTSRGTGRWILPKGWPHKGMDGAASALREAWEEAGVKRASVTRKPLGSYAAVKRHDDGLEQPCDVVVFRAEVSKLADDYPERHERQRLWVTTSEAADMVDEPGLKDLLRRFRQR